MLHAIAQAQVLFLSPTINLTQLFKFEGLLSHWGPDWEPTYINSPN